MTKSTQSDFLEAPYNAKNPKRISRFHERCIERSYFLTLELKPYVRFSDVW